MVWMKKKDKREQVEYLSVADICPNPHQPRTVFDEGALSSLADSIRRYGLLQPISVREEDGGYELIAGERRLRASQMAGLARVPCLVYRVTREQSSELAIMENLLREDLNMFETAAAMEGLCREHGLTQEEIAERLSVSQSYVANKLRLLRLPDGVRCAILENGLSERHARALLRLPPEGWEEALRAIIARGYNVAAAERYIEERLSALDRPKKAKPRMHGAVRDLRLFYNSVDHAMDMVRRCGVNVKSRREEGETEIRLIITIPKRSG